MKYFYTLALVFLSFSAALGQTLIKNSFEHVPFGWDRKFRTQVKFNELNFKKLSKPIYYGEGFVYNGRVYFTASPQETKNKGLIAHDSIYAYDIQQQKLYAGPERGLFLRTKDGMSRFNIYYQEENKKSVDLMLVRTPVNEESLVSSSKKIINEFHKTTKKKTAVTYFSESVFSPDSSFFANIFFFNQGDDANIVNVTLFDAKNEESSKFKFDISKVSSRCNYYRCCVDNKGAVYLTSFKSDGGKESQKVDIEIIKATEDYQEVFYKTSTSIAQLENSLQLQWLKNNRLLVYFLHDDKGRKLANETIACDIINMANGKSTIGGLQNYKIPDLWTNKQKADLNDYWNFDIVNVMQTENGNVYFFGFPHTVIIYNGSNVYTKYAHFSMGGAFLLPVLPDGTQGETKFLDHFVKKERSDAYSLEDNCMALGSFAYGNNVYVLYNESLKKLQDPTSNDAYKAHEEEFNILCQRFGDDGDKLFNLTPDEKPTQAFSSILAHNNNLFYLATRGEESGSIYTLELPVYKKPVAQKPSSAASSSASTKKSSAKKSTGGRGRKIKR